MSGKTKRRIFVSLVAAIGVQAIILAIFFIFISGLGDIPFDREKWFAANPDKDNVRWRMARSLLRQDKFYGKTQAEIEAMIGKPDYTHNAPPFDVTFYYSVGNDEFTMDIDTHMRLALYFRNGKVVQVAFTRS